MGADGASGRSRFERVYSLVVTVKGVDGLAELVGGLALLIAPAATGHGLLVVAAELAEGSSPLRAASAHALAAAGTGVAAGALPLSLFLLVHGVVKLLTVYALLRRALRWYPLALAALVVLLVVQVVDLVGAPALGGALLTVLDVAVVALVAWEYRRLRRAPAPARAPLPDREPVR